MLMPFPGTILSGNGRTTQHFSPAFPQPGPNPAVVVPAAQAMVSVFQNHSSPDLRSLQEVDFLIQNFLLASVKPTYEERQQLPALVLTPLKKWDRLVEKDGVLYQRVFRPNCGEECFQLVLPAVLKEQVRTQLHQDHGHEGIERTAELVRQCCYWPGMSADIKQWARPVNAAMWPKTLGLCHNFTGHLLASRPNEHNIVELDSKFYV